MVRQTRAMKAASAAWGGGGDHEEEPSYSKRLRGEKSKKPEKRYTPTWLIDPSKGGEATPVFGQNEAQALPINLGYTIMGEEENSS